MTDFIFLGSKITMDGDCSHEIKRQLLLGRKAMTKVDSVLKSRSITLLTKVCLVKAMVFPVVMYGCESWTIKKTERWRIDALELWCWRRLLRVLWTARWSNQSILKEIKLEYSMEVLMLKLQYLATWCEKSTHWKRPWCWERWKARGTEDDRGWDSCMASLAQWTRVRANCGGWWRTGKTGVLQSMREQRVGHDLATEQQKHPGLDARNSQTTALNPKVYFHCNKPCCFLIGGFQFVSSRLMGFIALISTSNIFTSKLYP